MESKRLFGMVLLPDPTESLPLFCQVAAVDGGQGRRKRLVVVGGWHPETWAPMNSVHVYDILTGAWRPGAPMPGPRRSFFACAAVGGTVYVAGGHDEEKNALRSALAYDPEADAWTEVRDMAAERDEPRGLCAGGRFLVVGGYPTERMYMLRDGHLVARDARTAATVSALPDGRAVVIGSACHGGDQIVYVLREEAGKGASWGSAPAPPQFSGHVMASSFLEI